MPRGSAELTEARRNEIIGACAALYQTTSFKDITLKEIGNATSFSRANIYNYFQTKEEIFLALLQREYEAWTRDLDALHDGHDALTADEFADELAHTLESREQLLKIMSMNHYDMEDNSRMERLVDFKAAYGASMRAVERCLKKFFPSMADADVQGFVYAFFPFLFGVYPYTVVSDKQREAMEEAHANYVFLSLHEIVRACAKKLLANCD